jgi:Secretion system C-terminal sorting domain/Pregnancy-associated plasma protein-A
MKNTSNYLPYHFAFFAIFILAFCQRLKAQQTICLTNPSTNHCEYDPNWNDQNEPGPFYIRTYIHVIRNSAGTGGQSASEVQEALGFLDQAFNPHNIFFVPDCEIDYIDDNSYFNINGTSAIFSVNNHPDGIDIYLFPDRPFPLNEGGGLASDFCSKEFYVAGNFWLPPYTSIVRSHVISHEMGHCLGLYHTFDFSDIVNDPNCAGGDSFTPNGDFICDTPADPNMDFDVNPATCQWGGSGNDQNGDPFNPDETNIMAYSHVDCQNHFSNGQGQLMRNIIANLPLLQNCLINTLANPSITASPIPTTWSASEYRISGTLNIESGATLIIPSTTTLRFAEGSRVVINPNATLKLSGTLTSFCDLTWKGVEVWGNSSASQVPQGGALAQGKFIGLSGSVVENAETGAQLWGPDFNTGAGGQIVCTGTTFKNNIIGVNAAPFQNFWPHSIPPGWLNKPLNYVGSFTGCSFETNNDYPHTNNFFAFANLATVNGFRFSGCHFENALELQDCNDISDFGFGIFAQNSGFTVNGQCLDIFLPCANYNRSLFKGLGYGIHTQTLSQNRPYIVEMSDFEDCFFGIYQNEITGATVVGNNFFLGNLPNTDCTSDQFGAVLSMGTNGITFQENKFLKVPGNVSNTTGSYSIRLGVFNNIIRRNTYDGITYGNVAAAQCGTFNAIPTGLLYECNKNFNLEQYDFIVHTSLPGLPNGIIRKKQGLISQINPNSFFAAGNRFSYTGIPNDSDFKGQGQINGFPHEYYYNPMATNEEPLQFSLIDKLEGLPNACAPEYCIPPCKYPYEVALQKNQFYSNNSTYQIAKTAYQSAVNTGNYALAQVKAIEAGFARQKMDEAAHMVLLHMMYDTVTYQRDTVRTWLSNVNTYDSDILLSKDYLDANQFAQAQYILNQIPGKFDVTASDLSDLQSLSSIYSMIAQNTLLDLDENDLASLSIIAHGDLSYSTNLARGILELYRVEFFHPSLYDGEERSGSRNQEKAKNLQLPIKDAFKVFPNPTSDILFISGDITDLVFKLTNVSGGTVLLKNLTGESQQQGLEVHNLPDGFYFYEISAKKGKDKLQHGKIVIKK